MERIGETPSDLRKNKNISLSERGTGENRAYIPGHESGSCTRGTAWGRSEVREMQSLLIILKLHLRK